MNPVSDTAFLTCGARADDADKLRPICNDRYAGRFLEEDGLAIYRQFKKEPGPLASIVARHRLIDDLLRERIDQNGNTAVVIIGAGFDSRAFRLKGGRWTEIDEPQVVERKNRILPASDSANPLRRIAIDFANEALADKLPPYSADTPVVVVMEGIFVYLSPAQRKATFDALRLRYPRHVLICDLSTRAFMERHGKSLKQRIEALGAKLDSLSDDPAAEFADAGYLIEARHSLIEKTLVYAGNAIASLMLWFLPRSMRDGLGLYVFRQVPG